jgi:hypothetical protein
MDDKWTWAGAKPAVAAATPLARSEEDVLAAVKLKLEPIFQALTTAVEADTVDPVYKQRILRTFAELNPMLAQIGFD